MIHFLFVLVNKTTTWTDPRVAGPVSMRKIIRNDILEGKVHLITVVLYRSRRDFVSPCSVTCCFSKRIETRTISFSFLLTIGGPIFKRL